LSGASPLQSRAPATPALGPRRRHQSQLSYTENILGHRLLRIAPLRVDVQDDVGLGARASSSDLARGPRTTSSVLRAGSARTEAGVEIESLQLNLWTLGLVWFIVTFHDVPFQ